MAELFEDFSGETAAAAAQPQAAPADIPPQDVLDEALDESVDPLDQIALAKPELAFPKPLAPTAIQVYEWSVVDSASLGNAFTGKVKNRFIRPVAIAVQSEYLYIVDEGYDALYRYDLVSGRLEVVFDLKAKVKGEVADIYVNKDFSFYLTDTEGARVLHYDSRGRLIQEFRNHFNLVKPVAVSAAENGGLVVADAHYDHLLHFRNDGELIATYGGRGDAVGEFLNIMTIAKGPDGYYVGARVGRRLQVLGMDGNYLYAFEEGVAVFPASIVVGQDNRSYVADYMDNTIKVFDRGSPIGIIGGHGTEPGRFKRITDLWLDGNTLYIVDSLNGRIQAAKLAPDPLPQPDAEFESDAGLLQETLEEPATVSSVPSLESVDEQAEKPASSSTDLAAPKPAEPTDSAQ